jgi:hypothetical protein
VLRLNPGLTAAKLRRHLRFLEPCPH